MPSVSGGALQRSSSVSGVSFQRHVSFYALDVGRGFATFISGSRETRNCSSSSGFYALGVGRGFATAASTSIVSTSRTVSMPSVSGGALQQMPSGGASDLRVCSLLRQPTREQLQTVSIGPPLFRQGPDQLLSLRQPSQKTMFAGASAPALRAAMPLSISLRKRPTGDGTRRRERRWPGCCPRSHRRLPAGRRRRGRPFGQRPPPVLSLPSPRPGSCRPRPARTLQQCRSRARPACPSLTVEARGTPRTPACCTKYWFKHIR
jgi:hypothetical protein